MVIRTPSSGCDETCALSARCSISRRPNPRPFALPARLHEAAAEVAHDHHERSVGDASLEREDGNEDGILVVARVTVQHAVGTRLGHGQANVLRQLALDAKALAEPRDFAANAPRLPRPLLGPRGSNARAHPSCARFRHRQPKIPLLGREARFHRLSARVSQIREGNGAPLPVAERVNVPLGDPRRASLLPPSGTLLFEAPEERCLVPTARPLPPDKRQI